MKRHMVFKIEPEWLEEDKDALSNTESELQEDKVTLDLVSKGEGEELRQDEDTLDFVQVQLLDEIKIENHPIVLEGSMNTECRSREIRSTNEQMNAMLNFMIQHPAFAHGKLFGPSGRAKSIELWENLAKLLNSVVSGPVKNVSKWQKTWIDWKCNTKKKFSKIRQHGRGADKGSPSTVKLSDMEARFIEWITPEVVECDTSLPEAGIGGSTAASPPPSTAAACEATPIHMEILEELPVTVEVDDAEITCRPARSNSQKRRRANTLHELVDVETRRAALDEEHLLLKRRKLALYEERTKVIKEGMDHGISAILSLANALQRNT